MEDFMKGLQILLKYNPEKYHGLAADHDIIYIEGVVPEDVSEEDAKELERLGFHRDEFGSYASFV